jgi:ribosomal protein S18
VIVQDYDDIPVGASFIEAMYNAIENARVRRLERFVSERGKVHSS